MQIEDGLYLRLKHMADLKQVALYDLVHTYLNWCVSYDEWMSYHNNQRRTDLQDTLEALIIEQGESKEEMHRNGHSKVSAHLI
jgi:hypothetical protein